MPDEKLKAIKNLIEHKYSAIQKADKGNTIVILDKNDNILKLNQILDDTSKFKRLHLEEESLNGYWFTQKLKNLKWNFREKSS